MSIRGLLSAIDPTTGEIRLISEVSRGKACGCVCAQCRQPLVAKKGERVTHHFSHSATGGTGADNDDCQETALHNAGKRLLAYHLDTLSIPVKHLGRPSRQFVLPTQQKLTFSQVLTPENRQLTPGDGDIEPTLSADTLLRPDAIISTQELGDIYVEVIVSNPISSEKKRVYKDLELTVLGIDLSACDASEIGLEDLKDLVAAEAPRQWVSFEVPAAARNAMVEHDKRVEELAQKQSKAITEALQHQPPDGWLEQPSVMFTTIEFEGQHIPIHCKLTRPQVRAENGYWLTSSVAGLKLPVFFDPIDIALTKFREYYRSHRDRPLSALIVSRGAVTVSIGTGERSRLEAVLRWVLRQRTTDRPFSFHRLIARDIAPVNYSPGPIQPRTPTMRYQWIDGWADPPVTQQNVSGEGVFCATVPEDFARACIENEIAGLIVDPSEQHRPAVASADFVKRVGNIHFPGEFYSRIRENLEAGRAPPQCRLILEEGRYSRTLNIAKGIRLIDGALYLDARHCHIPIQMEKATTNRRAPIFLLKNLSVAQQRLVFQADSNALAYQLARSKGGTEADALRAFVESFDPI